MILKENTMPHSEKEQNEPIVQDTPCEAPEIPEETELDELLLSAVSEEEEATLDEANEEQGPSATVQALSFVFDIAELFAISFAAVIIVLCFFLRHSPVSGESMMPTIQHKDTLLVSDLGYTPAHGDVVIVQSLHNPEKPLVKRVIAVGGDKIEINFERWMIKVNGIVIEQRLDANGNPSKIGGDYVYYVEGSSMRMGATDGADLYKIGFTYDAPSGNYVATVPEGRLFILGDNRNDSKDSRDASVGFVDERLVVGKAIYRLSPFSQMGTLD